MPAQDNTQATTTSDGGTTRTNSGSKSGGKRGGSGGGGQTQSGQASKPAGGKPSGGGGGSPFMSGTPGYQPSSEGFFGFNPRPIAGASPLLDYAGALATGLPSAGQGGVNAGYNALGQAQNLYSSLTQLPGQTNEAMDLYRSLPSIAGQQVTGANVANDPAVKEAQRVFETTMAPMIKDAAGLAGIGKSGAMTNAMSAQQAQTLLPLIQGSMAREERGIDRMLGGTQAAAGGLFQGGAQQAGQIGQAAAGMGQTAGQYGALGGQEQNMLMNAIGGLSGLGEQFRGIEQEMLNAPYDEQMRLYTEALNSIYGPFGMIPGLTGSVSTQSGKKR